MADDLTRLAIDLAAAGVGARVDARKLVQVEMHTVKREWQSAWTGITGMPHIARSITYDTRETPIGTEGEVGPDPSRPQGPLDNIVEYGSSQHGPIRPVTHRLATDAGARLEKYLADVAGDLL